MDSILQSKKECYFCPNHNTEELHSHHVFFGTANKRLSEEDGMKIWLCGKHHNLSHQEGIHFRNDIDLDVKKKAQEAWEKTYGDRSDFIKRYGKSYL